MRETLISSIQKNTEVDEPEAVAAPLLPPERRAPMLGRDDLSSDTQVDVMTEEQLLRGLESMTPLEPSANIGSGGGPRERDRDPRGPVSLRLRTRHARDTAIEPFHFNPSCVFGYACAQKECGGS